MEKEKDSDAVTKPKTFTQISKETGLAPNTVKYYVDRGMPREAGPERDRWLEEWKKEHVEKRSKSNRDPELLELEKDLLREKIAEVKDRRRKRNGELVERKSVEMKLRRQITDARVMLKTIPVIVAKFVPEGDARDTVRDQVDNVIDNILEGLASAK